MYSPVGYSQIVWLSAKYTSPIANESNDTILGTNYVLLELKAEYISGPGVLFLTHLKAMNFVLSK